MDLSKILWFRRMSEIGGILLGIAIGLEFSKRIEISWGLWVVGFAIAAMAVLLYEDKEWRKYKKDRK